MRPHGCARRAAGALPVVGAREADGVRVECERTAYLVPGYRLHRRDGDQCGAEHDAAGLAAATRPPSSCSAAIGCGLGVARPGRDAQAARGQDRTPAATIGCTLPEVFAQVRPGERIWFDDGRIGGVVRRVPAEDGCDVEITDAREGGDKLAADKGINLPDSDLAPAGADRTRTSQDLAFVGAHADLVGLSFVQTADDVAARCAPR